MVGLVRPELHHFCQFFKKIVSYIKDVIVGFINYLSQRLTMAYVYCGQLKNFLHGQISQQTSYFPKVINAQCNYVCYYK